MRAGLGRQRRFATARVFAVFVATALAVSACGGGSGGNGGSGDSDEGVLNYGYDWGLSSFDPAKAGRSLDNPWLYPVYDRLVHAAPSGEAIPGLATSWKYNDSGDQLTFKLRENVKFQDGEPFNADAVKGNIDRAKAANSAVSPDLANVKSVAVVDDLTVTVNLATPDASIVLTLSERPGMMVSPKAFDNKDLGRNPVGAGPYKVTKFSPGSSAVYKPWSGYWNAKEVKLKKLEIFEMSDPSTRRNALKSGQLNWAKIATTDVATFKGDAKFDVKLFDSVSYVNLAMNRSRKFFKDVRVRQAMNYAIDRQAILDSVYGGMGKIDVQPFPEGHFAHDPASSAATYPHDPAKAKALLKAAGYPNGFTFEHVVPSTGEGPRVAEVLQAQLAEVGLKMKIKTIDPTQASDLWGVQHKGDSLQGTWGGRPDPSPTFFAQYSPTGFFNTGGHVDKEYNDLYATALTTLDPDARAKALQAVTHRVVEAALDNVILFPSTPNVVAKDVKGAQGYITGPQEFTGVSVGG